MCFDACTFLILAMFCVGLVLDVLAQHCRCDTPLIEILQLSFRTTEGLAGEAQKRRVGPVV
jgi:hypothetical protein